MEAVLKLCTRGIVFESGRVRVDGDVEAVVSEFLSSRSSSPRVVDLSIKPRPEYVPSTGKVRLAKVFPSDGETGWSLPFGQQVSLDILVDAQSSLTDVEVFVEIHSVRGFKVATWSNTCSGVKLSLRSGINAFRVGFPQLQLLPGHYFLGMSLVSKSVLEDYVNEAVFFEVISSSEAARINTQNLGGFMVPTGTISILD
jgi:hypothetical protein